MHVLANVHVDVWLLGLKSGADHMCLGPENQKPRDVTTGPPVSRLTGQTIETSLTISKPILLLYNKSLLGSHPTKHTHNHGFHPPQTPRLLPSRSLPPPLSQKLPAQPPSIARQRAAQLQRRRAECRRRAEFQASCWQRWETGEAAVGFLGMDGYAFADEESGA